MTLTAQSYRLGSLLELYNTKDKVERGSCCVMEMTSSTKCMTAAAAIAVVVVVILSAQNAGKSQVRYWAMQSANAAASPLVCRALVLMQSLEGHAPAVVLFAVSMAMVQQIRVRIRSGQGGMGQFLGEKTHPKTDNPPFSL